ncbi:MAG: hypothetical protein ABW189_04650 [Rickettsiales bacterium]
MKGAHLASLMGFFAALAAQVALWNRYKAEKPDFIVVPEPPSLRSVEAYSLGDKELYFRKLVFTLQNAGDTFGRFTALREYDYAKLSEWFTLADALDKRSEATPTMAGYYYSQTQNVPDTQYVVDYLVAHVKRNADAPEKKWWWLVQAIYLAEHRLNDTKQALNIAYMLEDFPASAVPIWAKQMPAFLHEKRGENEAALRIMDMAFKQYSENDHISEGELNFIQNFIRNRIEALPDSGTLDKNVDAYRAKRGLGAYPEKK